MYFTYAEWSQGGAGCANNGSIGNHGLGIAIDINPLQNPMSKNFKTDHPPELQAIMKLCGFQLGSEFGSKPGDKTPPDTQHFDWVGDLAAAEQEWKDCIEAGEDHYYDTNWPKVTSDPAAFAAGSGPSIGPETEVSVADEAGEATIEAVEALPVRVEF